MIGHSAEDFVVGQPTAISFGGASVAQVIKLMKSQNEDRAETLILMIGTMLQGSRSHQR